MVDYNTKPEIKTEIVRVEKQDIDLKTLADTVAKAIIDQMPKTEFFKARAIPYENNNPSETEWWDNVRNNTDKSTMEKLAQSMIVQREDNESNFKDLGNTVETKKDNTETNNIIDMLKEIE